MKKLLVILAMLVAMSANAQWEPDFRLTNLPTNSFTSGNNARCVATSGSVVHVVFDDWRVHGNSGEIYYKRSTNAGVSWEVETPLTTAWSVTPSIAVYGSFVHVVWVLAYGSVSNGQICYKRSTDAGESWIADVQLTNDSADSKRTSIAVSGSNVYVVWTSNRDGNYEIYYKRSTDAGANWGANTRLTNSTGTSDHPCVAVSGSSINVVWSDNRDGNYEIYYKRSTDAGNSWGADTRLTNNSAISETPTLEVSGSVVHVLWNDWRDSLGRNKVYYKRSTDAGINWNANLCLVSNSIGSVSPSATISDSIVHLVWADYRDGNLEIYYKRSSNKGVNWGTDTRLTNANYSSQHPSVAVSGSVVHVVWYDYRWGAYALYYKRNPTGNTIGIQNISTETPSKYSLSQNYPNPFNSTSNLKFSIVNSGYVKLVVYDIMGKEVQTLVNESLKPGTYEAAFDASSLNSGVYFYKLITNGFTETKKMLMIK